MKIISIVWIFSLVHAVIRSVKKRSIAGLVFDGLIAVFSLGFIVFYGVYSYNLPLNSLDIRTDKMIPHVQMTFYLGFIFELLRQIMIRDRVRNMSLNTWTRPSPQLYYLVIILIISSLLFGVDRSLSLSSYKPRISPFFEYNYLWFFFLLIFRPRKKIAEHLIWALAVAVVYTDLSFGGRITSIQLVLILILYYSEHLRPHFIKLSVGLSVLFALLVYIGFSRSGINLDVISFFRSALVMLANLDTAIFAFHSSIIIVYAAEVTSALIRLESLTGNILGLIFGSSFVSNLGFRSVNVSIYTQDNIAFTLGGGYVWSYFYYWFGKIGSVLGSIFLLSICRWSIYRNRKNGMFKLLIILILATLPRWFMYNVQVFFRVPFVLYPVFYILFLLLNDVSRKVLKKSS